MYIDGHPSFQPPVQRDTADSASLRRPIPHENVVTTLEEQTRFGLCYLNPIAEGKEAQAAELFDDIYANMKTVARQHAPKAMMELDQAWRTTLNAILAERPHLKEADFDFVVDKKTPGTQAGLQITGDTLSERDRQWLTQKINSNIPLVKAANAYTDALMTTYAKYRDLSKLMHSSGAADKAERNYNQALASMSDIPFRKLLNTLHDYQMQEFGYLYTHNGGLKTADNAKTLPGASYQAMYRHAQAFSNEYILAENVLGLAGPEKNNLDIDCEMIFYETVIIFYSNND